MSLPQVAGTDARVPAYEHLSLKCDVRSKSTLVSPDRGIELRGSNSQISRNFLSREIELWSCDYHSSMLSPGVPAPRRALSRISCSRRRLVERALASARGETKIGEVRYEASAK